MADAHRKVEQAERQARELEAEQERQVRRRAPAVYVSEYVLALPVAHFSAWCGVAPVALFNELFFRTVPAHAGEERRGDCLSLR